MSLLVTYLFIAIGVSFLCSILEAVLLSVTPGFVESQSTLHPRRARALKEVKDNLDESISSILILNTFAHTMGAAGVGAKAVDIFGAKWETLVAVLLTLAILYFSEIIPKTLGARFWQQLALPTAHVIKWLVKLLYPLVWLSAKLTNLISPGSQVSTVSRDELEALARLGVLSTKLLQLMHIRILLFVQQYRDECKKYFYLTVRSFLYFYIFFFFLFFLFYIILVILNF